jgi:hypothetical protein
VVRAKDGVQLKLLVAELGVDETLRRLERFFVSTHQWIRQSDYGVGAFVAGSNRVANETPRNWHGAWAPKPAPPGCPDVACEKCGRPGCECEGCRAFAAANLQKVRAVIASAVGGADWMGETKRDRATDREARPDPTRLTLRPIGVAFSGAN